MDLRKEFILKRVIMDNPVTKFKCNLKLNLWQSLIKRKFVLN